MYNSDFLLLRRVVYFIGKVLQTLGIYTILFVCHFYLKRLSRLE